VPVSYDAVEESSIGYEKRKRFKPLSISVEKSASPKRSIPRFFIKAKIRKWVHGAGGFSAFPGFMTQ
jgi:hypothetical protein